MKTVELNDILFPVRIENNAYNANRENSLVVVAELPDGERALNFVSPRYNLISNGEMILPILNLLNTSGIKYESTYRSNEDMTRFECTLTLKEMYDESLAVKVGQGDYIYPQMKLIKSFNSSKLYTITFGYFRMVCSNGLVIPVEGKENMNYVISGKHTAKLSESLDRLEATMYHFIDSQKTIAKRFKVLTDRPVLNWVERLETVMKTNKIAASKEQFSDIEMQIRNEMKQLNAANVNDWLIYNGINWHINNKNKKEGMDTKMQKDAKVLSYMMSN